MIRLFIVACQAAIGVLLGMNGQVPGAMAMVACALVVYASTTTSNTSKGVTQGKHILLSKEAPSPPNAKQGVSVLAKGEPTQAPEENIDVAPSSASSSECSESESGDEAVDTTTTSTSTSTRSPPASLTTRAAAAPAYLAPTSTLKLAPTSTQAMRAGPSMPAVGRSTARRLARGSGRSPLLRAPTASPFSAPSLAGPVAGSRVDGIISAHKPSYGFIHVVDGTPDWFFHVSELKGHAFPTGTLVTFQVGIDRKNGRQLAIDVRLRVESAAAYHEDGRRAATHSSKTSTRSIDRPEQVIPRWQRTAPPRMQSTGRSLADMEARYARAQGVQA